MPSEQLQSLVRSPAAPLASKPSRRLRDRLHLFLPLGLLLGFAALLGALFGDRLIPAQSVEVVNVLTVDDTTGAVETSPRPASADAFEAPVLFQASGWFEPDPLPVKATALVAGVVDEVHVLEGERVKRGQVIATLIDDDARLDLATAKATRASQRAKMDANTAAIRVATTRIDTMTQRIAAAEAMLGLRRDASERLQTVGADSVAEGEIVQARLRVAAQEAEVAALRSELAELEGHIEQLRAVGRELEAQVALAETDVDRKQLALDRTRVRAPVDGRILRLFAVPGQQRMLGSENKDSGVIAYLYEPDKLQARIDVPLAEAAQIEVGQAVKVRTNFLPDVVFRATVTRITGEADLQRNTLQAKVAIHEPDERLRPDMLCRAAFLAPAQAAGSSGVATATGSALSRVRVFVPEAALVDRSGRTASVWMLSGEDRRATLQPLTLGSERRDAFILAVAGANPGDRLIVNPPETLTDGARVRRVKPNPAPTNDS